VKRIILAALLAFISISANAGGMTTTPITTTTSTSASNSNTDNRLYAGLKWTLNNKVSSPEIVVGFRHSDVEFNGDTQGGDISLSFGILDGFTLGKIRTKYFNGNETIQAEIGAGYDFANGLFTGAGFNLPYATMGTDYLLSSDSDSKWQPNFILHTRTDYERKTTTTNTTTLSCIPGFSLNTTTNQCNSDGGAP
jgi:hypothetical protein